MYTDSHSGITHRPPSCLPLLRRIVSVIARFQDAQAVDRLVQAERVMWRWVCQPHGEALLT